MLSIRTLKNTILTVLAKSGQTSILSLETSSKSNYNATHVSLWVLSGINFDFEALPYNV